MRRRRLGVEKSPDIMIIPMIDIVFFLLVFFMMSMLHMTFTQEIPLQLPSSVTADTKAHETITISIDEKGRIYVQGQAYTKEALTAFVAKAIEADRNHSFLIRASKDVVYNEVVQVLDLLKANGAKYVSIATERK